MQAILMASDLRRLITATKAFVAVSDSRPIHQYIRLDFNKELGSASAIAVDGYRLSIEHAVCGDIDEDFTAYIKPALPKASINDKAIIEVKDGFCFIRVNDNIVGTRQPGGEFSDCKETISSLDKSPPSYRIGFNGDYLLAALQAAKASCGNSFRTPVILEFRSNQQPIVLRTNKEDIKIVLPVRIKGNEE